MPTGVPAGKVDHATHPPSVAGEQLALAYAYLVLAEALITEAHDLYPSAPLYTAPRMHLMQAVDETREARTGLAREVSIRAGDTREALHMVLAMLPAPESEQGE